MSAVIGALRGVLSMDSAAFESGAKRAQATMGTVERRMVRMGGRMERAGRKMALGLTLPMAGAAAVAVKSSLKVIDAQAKMAQSLGGTVQAMQVLERAAELSGVSLEGVGTGLKDMTRRLSQAAAGGGPVADALSRIHLNARDLIKLPLDQRVARINEGLERFVPAAERAAVAGQLFGEEGSLAMTRIDTATLEIAARDVERFGVAVSEVDADQLESANDAMSRMGLAGRGLANQLTIALVPTLQALSDSAADAAAWFNGLSDGTKRFLAVGAGIAGAVGPAAVALGLVLKVTAPLGVAIAGMVSAVALAPVRFAAAAKSAVALEMALGATSTKAAVAGVAVKGLQRGLLLLRGAVIATGIGALVVGAGYLAMKFHELVTATGGWGMALQALGDLASGVWEGITTSAAAIGPGLQAVWNTVKAGFLKMVRGVQRTWTDFLHNMAAGARAAGLEELALDVHGFAVKAGSAVHDLTVKIDEQQAAAAAAKEEAKGLVREGWEKAAAALKTLTLQMDSANSELDAGDDSADELADSLDGLGDTLDGGAGGGVSGKLEKTAEEAGKLGQELKGPLSSAVDGVAGAFGDWVVNGLRDFESLWDGIKQTAKRGLADLAATFARNKLQVALGFSASGAGTAASAATGGGGGGLLNLAGSAVNLLGGGGLVSGFASGLGGILSGGGLGASFANLGGLVSGASGFTAGALGAALPAVGIIVGAAALLKKAFSREYRGARLETWFSHEGLVSGRYEDLYAGGFLRGDKWKSRALPEEMASALDLSMKSMAAGVIDLADTLGIGTEALDGMAARRMRLWTADRTSAEIQAKLEQHMRSTAEEMARLMLGTDEFSRAGETALETLGRLSGSLAAVNDAADMLSHRLFDVSLAGGDAASHLLDLFGGQEAMAAAANAFFASFYDAEERSEIFARRLAEQFEELGVVMPATRDEFRAMVEELDTTTASGRELYAGLLQLSGVMDEMLPRVSNLSAEVVGMVGEIGGEIGRQMDAAREAASASKAAAELWTRTAGTLRDFTAGLANSDLSAASGTQAAAVQRGRLDAALAAARSGDAEAAGSLPDLARAYLQSARAGAGSALEYRRIAAEVQGQVKLAAGAADLEAGKADYLAGLYEQQIEVLTGLGNFLQLEGLTDEQVGELSDGVRGLAEDWDGTVDAFQRSLGALETAISEAEAFSYDDLVGALDVAVSLSSDAPSWLRKLVRKSEGGIRATLDFILRRDDLSPADKWIATNAVSEHVAALDFVLRNDLDPRTRRLALQATGDLRRDLRLRLGKDLDAETRSLVLTRVQTLSRRVNVALTREGGAAVRQLSRLRDMIGGGGEFLFGGDVSFAPSNAFRSLFGGLTGAMEELGAPMGQLGDMLDALREQMRRDADERQIRALQLEGAQAVGGLSDSRDSGASLIEEIESLEARTGIRLYRDGGRDAVLELNRNGTIAYSADWTNGGPGLEAFNAEFRGPEGLQAQIYDYNSQINSQRERVRELRAQIRGLGGVPAFAAGGAHTGGVRIVGERGWEIENTGPSRLHSHAESVAMLDNRVVVRSVEALAKQVAAQGQRMEMLVRKIAQFTEEWHEIGLPEERS